MASPVVVPSIAPKSGDNGAEEYLVFDRTVYFFAWSNIFCEMLRLGCATSSAAPVVLEEHSNLAFLNASSIQIVLFSSIVVSLSGFVGFLV